MKNKKFLKTLILSVGIISSLSTVTAFAKSTSLTETSPCHTFTGYLNSKSGYGEASTRIDHSNYNKGADAYVYIESIDSNGYRLDKDDDRESGRAYASCDGHGASTYQSRHTVKDSTCKNRYLRISANA